MPEPQKPKAVIVDKRSFDALVGKLIATPDTAKRGIKPKPKSDAGRQAISEGQMIEALDALDAAEALLRRWNRAMADAGMAGSEFHDNPERCGQQYREHSETALRMAKGKKAAEARAQAAEKDTERLNWYMTILWRLEMDHRGWYLIDLDTGHVIGDRFHETPRAAIDYGMDVDAALELAASPQSPPSPQDAAIPK